MAEMDDKARDEFFSEAQEIIETFSRNLLSLDATSNKGADPSLINEAFRSVHTLKGLAGLFGANRLGALAHRLEDLLDALRLGRTELTPEVLDVLFSSVEVFGRLLESERDGSELEPTSYRKLLSDLEGMGKEGVRPAPAEDEYDLDPGMLAVLTEYEEHRLRVNIQAQVNLYRLRVTFELTSIDKELEAMKERARDYGEIITYLPTGETTSVETIELDLLMASPADLATMVGALGGDNVVVEEIPRKKVGKVSVATSPPEPQQTSWLAPPTSGGGPVESAAADEESSAIEASGTLRSLTRTVRVDIRRLDSLMNVVGELGIVKGSLAHLADQAMADGDRRLSMALQRLNRSFDRRIGELQDGILEMRMVPLGQVFDRLARVVRQISRELGKEIRLVITGGETEIDKLIVEELSDPLMHMIRNAIDHGIESTEDRADVGKPEAGTIALNAFQKGNHVMIEVEDDGRGIDEAALIQKAIYAGAVDPSLASELGRDDVLGLIFLPGLSTREEVGEMSGRGVGMDVVKTNIAKLGGVIDVHSEAGIGTKMTITLPITLAIVRALLVQCAGQTLAIPLASVSEALAFDPAGVRVVDGREVITLRGATLPLCRLARHLAIVEDVAFRRAFVVVASVGERRLGLVVDHLYGQQDIVIKPLGPSLSSVRGFSGATELGDQRVGLVLDAAAVIEEVLQIADGTRQEARRG